MKKLLLTIVLLLAVANLQAQSISHIETTKNWYYIYDQNGKKIKTLSTSQGELKGYSSTFYIIKQGSAFYITYDVNGKRLTGLIRLRNILWTMCLQIVMVSVSLPKT